MLGKDIEIIKRKKPQIQKIHYLNELPRHRSLNNNKVRPPSEILTNVDKIRVKNWFTKYLIEYANTTSFHGFNHLVAPNRHISERLVLLIVLIFSTMLLTMLSFYFWDTYNDFTIITSVHHNDYKFNISFPSVVFCPKIQIDENKIPTVFKKYGIPDTEMNRNFFITLTQLKTSVDPSKSNGINIKPDELLTILYELKPDIDDKEFLSFSMWIVTLSGLCLEFFNYASIYSTIEYWSQLQPVDKFQVKTFHCEYKDDCFMELKIAQSSHFWIYFVAPGDIPRHENRLSMNNETLKVKIYPHIVDTSENVLELPYNERNCKFNYENDLSMWPIYSYTRCEVESINYHLVNHCNCTHYYLPPLAGWPICSISQMKCLADKVKESVDKPVDMIDPTRKCYENCFLILYFLKEARAVPYKRKRKLKITLLFPKDRYQRSLEFPFLEFLVSVGGATSLFLGASILSFVEFFYFFTLGLFWYTVRTIRDRKKKLQIRKQFCI